MFAGTIVDELAAFRKILVLELVVVVFVAVCEIMIATRRGIDFLESIVEVDYGLRNWFELLEGPAFFLSRGDVDVCGAPVVNFHFHDLQQRLPVLLYIHPPLAFRTKRQLLGWRDKFKRICIVVNIMENGDAAGSC